MAVGACTAAPVRVARRWLVFVKLINAGDVDAVSTVGKPMPPFRCREHTLFGSDYGPEGQVVIRREIPEIGNLDADAIYIGIAESRGEETGTALNGRIRVRKVRKRDD